MSDQNKKRIIAIAGNPNAGKTTLFNALTGSTQRVGNWPGVTVEKKVGEFSVSGEKITVVDLPGIYSLTSHSEDEKVARDYLLAAEADTVINIVDASNLERNLFLTLSLIEMRVPVVVVLNMVDLAEKKGIRIDSSLLSQSLGVPVIPMSAVNSSDIKKLKTEFTEQFSLVTPSNFTVTYPESIEKILSAWAAPLSQIAKDLGTDTRWLSLKLLEEDTHLTSKITKLGALSIEDITQAIAEISTETSDTPDSLIASAKYESISASVLEAKKMGKERKQKGDKLDEIVLNRFLGIPLFIIVMYLLFAIVINFGGAFIDFFDILFGAVFVDGFAHVLGFFGSPQWLIALLANGVGAGIQTVATFVPIMFVMFFMLSVLEDSGYMARAAFVMDRALRSIGLPGKAFIPMIVGFGCSVPAIMATRTLENKRDRFLTVFMVPFMSCGARLPVYALFGAAFFGSSSGLIVLSLYLVGIVLAVGTGFMLKTSIFKGEPAPFVMELPVWHVPNVAGMFRHTWVRLSAFIGRAGSVIIMVVALLGVFNTIGIDGSIGNEDSSNSVLAVVGKTITPVFTPMGISKDNWPATVGIFTGLFAKEAVVGTLNGLYGQMDSQNKSNASKIDEIEIDDEPWNFASEVVAAFASIPEAFSGLASTLLDPMGMSMISADEEVVAEEIEADTGIFASLRTSFNNDGAAAYAYLLFILIYFPCIAALGAILREIGPLYGWISMLYLTVLAWITATLFYQFASGGSLLWILVAFSMLVAMIGAFYLAGIKKRSYKE